MGSEKSKTVLQDDKLDVKGVSTEVQKDDAFSDDLARKIDELIAATAQEDIDTLVDATEDQLKDFTNGIMKKVKKLIKEQLGDTLGSAKNQDEQATQDNFIEALTEEIA